jgi:hypothetical protein
MECLWASTLFAFAIEIDLSWLLIQQLYVIGLKTRLNVPGSALAKRVQVKVQDLARTVGHAQNDRLV